MKRSRWAPLRFVARLLDGEPVTKVCRSFGISRKTGYKIFSRYRIADCGEDGVDGIATRMGEIVSAHSVAFLEMTNDRLNCGAAFEVSFDLRCDAALLPGGVDLSNGIVSPALIMNSPTVVRCSPRNATRAPTRSVVRKIFLDFLPSLGFYYQK
jgi:hypothetical protein